MILLSTRLILPWKFQFQFLLNYGILALGEAHTRSAPSLSSLRKVAL